jgi:NAD(P)H-hydrate epimerase
LVGKPSPLLHKGRAGHALVIGGSDGLTGAPALAALGALRAGAGLVTVASPAGIMDTVKAGFPEFMALPLGRGGDGPPSETPCHVPAHAAWPRGWRRDMARELVVQLPRFQGVALGPGLGRARDTLEFLEELLPHLPAGSVLDADALFWLGQDKKLRERLPADMILTPHLGEMARLVGRPVPDIEADRAPVARDLARELSAVVVLKGPCTLVAAPGGRTHVSPVMAPCLATGGSGDVLAGVLAALRAGGLSPLPCACLGVYWHGLAGKSLENEHPRRGALAREIADALPGALKETTPC